MLWSDESTHGFDSTTHRQHFTTLKKQTRYSRTMFSDETSPLYIAIATAGAILGYILIKPIIFPTIVTYPWKEEREEENSTVLLAASYNPPHLGHLAMLEYLSKR